MIYFQSSTLSEDATKDAFNVKSVHIEDRMQDAALIVRLD